MDNVSLIEKLKTEVKVAFDFQKRKHPHWTENYELYRDHIKTNRLTQRQSVNFPIMKETVKTLLSQLDDFPEVYFECLETGQFKQQIVDEKIGGDFTGIAEEIEKEEDKIFYKEQSINELWKDTSDKLNYEGIDVLDKKNVLLTGRSFKKLNFLDDDFSVEVLDNWDVLVDPKTDPLDIETARWVIHQHIFRPLRDILANEKYTKEGKDELKKYLDTKEGIIVSESAKESLEEKQKRLTSLGVDNFDEMGASDTIVELKEVFTSVWDEKEEKFVRTLVIVGADNVILLNEPLKDVIGVEFYPFTTWGDDVDISDFWSDGVCDLVRTPNRIMNIWLSQLLENRTLRNYSMFWYDSTNPAFVPQTFSPKPFGMYPSPGDPNKMIQQISIPDLGSTVNEMSFIRSIVERSTSATSIEKGVSERANITLGEVQKLASKSEERIVAMSKSYRRAWKEFAWKWLEIMKTNASRAKVSKLYKMSESGKAYEKSITMKDWVSEAGYKVNITSVVEKDTEQLETIKKWMVLREQFPENMVFQKIAQRKIMENMGMTPEEMNEVETFKSQPLVEPPVDPPVGQLVEPLVEPLVEQPVNL